MFAVRLARRNPQDEQAFRVKRSVSIIVICTVGSLHLTRGDPLLLENTRPRRFPRAVGLSSENAAHRIAVVWEDETGPREGVYIPRRDTGSLVNHLAGGRLFPGEHRRATFRVTEDEGHIALRMRSADRHIEIDVVARPAEKLPETSTFGTVDEASAFFESGGMSYSVTSSGSRLDGVVLRTESWNVEPLAVERVRSTYFDDLVPFPAGSIAFDCGLIMRNIPHEWETAEEMYLLRKNSVVDIGEQR